MRVFGKYVSVFGVFAISFGIVFDVYAQGSVVPSQVADVGGNLLVAAPIVSTPVSPGPPGLGFTSAALAGDPNALPAEVKILRSIEKEFKDKYSKISVDPSAIPSLVFTPAQHVLLREARVGFNTRLPTLEELRDHPDPNDPNYRPPVALREISLGGIVFYSPDDWTIWLNSKRVTPDAMPTEAVDLRVYKEYIELRWFDSGTNQIYPIRLRPNQRFNIDGRIFLPG